METIVRKAKIVKRRQLVKAVWKEKQQKLVRKDK